MFDAARAALVLFTLTLTLGCGSKNPLAPSPPAPAGPRFLLAGQSNAAGLRDCCMVSDSIAILAVAPVAYWLNSAEFAAAARNQDLIALVWWQGAADALTSHDDYASRLRAVIAIARTSNAQLPVRIIEIPDTPDRATVRAAQREVANDSGVQLIPTGDLTADADGHYGYQGYLAVKERINRSLNR